jgi:hypothetical protein
MVKGCRLLKVCCAPMVYYFYAAERNIRLRGLCANLLFIAEHSDARDALSRADGSGNYRSRVFAFGQDYVLRVCGGALA